MICLFPPKVLIIGMHMGFHYTDGDISFGCVKETMYSLLYINSLWG